MNRFSEQLHQFPFENADTVHFSCFVSNFKVSFSSAQIKGKIGNLLIHFDETPNAGCLPQLAVIGW
jgi:hypothetical protein